mgnify:CR=1 FL=1
MHLRNVVFLHMIKLFNVEFEMTILKRVQTRVKRSKSSVFLRSDFKDIADYDQVGRALRLLVIQESLLKIGYGLYVRARINRITGKPMPDNPAGADGVMIEAMGKLGVDFEFDKLSLMNMRGTSTQIPSKVNINPTSSRFKRKIVVGNQRVNAI